jgi:hypothetical protein
MRWVMCTAIAVGVLLGLAPIAAAEHSVLDHISVGPNGGNGAFDAHPTDASDDGRSIVVHTAEQLLSQDTDDRGDEYLRVGGATALLTGPPLFTPPNPGAFSGGHLSNDGSRFVFMSDEQLSADDTDGGWTDGYMWLGGAFTLLTASPPGGNGPFPVNVRRVSADGTRIFFNTEEQVTADDTDTLHDIYESHNGIVRRMETGFGTPNPDTIVLSRPTGDRFFFGTANALVPEDNDNSTGDVYELTDQGPRLVSTGPLGGNGAFNGFFAVMTVEISDDGNHAMWETWEPLVDEDTDTAKDIYERFNGTTRLVSTGPDGGNGPYDVNDSSEEKFGAGGGGGMSADGSRIFFFTFERLVSQDTDDKRDVYMREGDTTTLVSIGPSGGNGPHDASGITNFPGGGTAITEDGSHAYFTTAEQLTANDTDPDVDLYDWSNGVLTLVAPQCLDGTSCTSTNGGFTPAFVHASHDGSRLFFLTGERILSGYPSGLPLLFEKHNGTVSGIPGFPVGWPEATSALFPQDGRQVVFRTRAKVLSSDTDDQLDVYSASVAPSGYPRPKSASPVDVSVAPAYRQCDTPNRMHGPPLAFQSCSPPHQTSDNLAVGTADSNGQPTRSVSKVKFGVHVGDPSTTLDEADIRIQADINDVRWRSDLSDYTGELQVVAMMRITDRWNAAAPGGGTDPATVIDLPFPVTLPCAATANTAVGSSCVVDTTFDAVIPGGVKERQRTVWELGATRVEDGGADGIVGTAPNQLFMTQSLFVP